MNTPVPASILMALLYAGAFAQESTQCKFSLGVSAEMSKRLGFRLYGQPGVQQFRISHGATAFGDYTDSGEVEGLISEN